MAPRIDSVTVLSGDPVIRAGDVIRLLTEHDDRLAESNFLEDLEIEARSAVTDGDLDRLLSIKDFWWCGEFSGSSFDLFKEEVAPCVRNMHLSENLDLAVSWEDGGMEGLRIQEGKVIECDVELVLRPRG